MILGVNETPGPEAVRKQLKHMFAAKLFRAADKQSRLLSYIVESALAGKSISEKDILRDLFPSYDPEFNSIRANINYLRSRLDKYYGTSGLNDPVIIALPPGPAYKAIFFYHQQAEPVRHHTRGLLYVQNGLLSKAVGEFLDLEEIAPTYPPLHESQSRLRFLRMLTSHLFWAGETQPIAQYGLNFERTAHMLKLEPGSCAPHILIGVSALLRRDWKAARNAFDQALSIDPLATGADPWYALYLLISKNTQQALAIAKSNAIEQPDNIYVWLIYGCFLYLARHFEEALEAAYQVYGTGLPRFLQAVLAGLIDLELKKYQRARYEFAVASSVNIEQEVDWFGAILNVETLERPERLEGLIAWSFSLQGRTDEAEAILRTMKQQSYVRPIQMAFAHLASGYMERSITCLRRACLQGDIIVLCLHLLPVLDPFRTEPRFQRLIQQFAFQS